MAKNLFKTKNIVDGLVNIGVGGAANVAVDYAISNIDMLAEYSDDTKNLAKFALGVVGSSMVGNKMVKAAFDGVATVGFSNYITSLINDTTASTTAGLPDGMIGRPRYIPVRRNLANSMRKQRIQGVKTLME